MPVGAKAIPGCGLGVLQAHEQALVELAVHAGPAEIRQFCAVLADLNDPDRDRRRVHPAGGRMVRMVRLGDLMHLDAMLDPALGAQLKATLTAMANKAAAQARQAAREQAARDDQQAAHGSDAQDGDDSPGDISGGGPGGGPGGGSDSGGGHGSGGNGWGVGSG